MAKCRECSREATEESGRCFSCAEELACMLHDLKAEFPEHADRIDPASAYNRKPRSNSFGIGDLVHVRRAPANELQGEIIREDAIDTQHRWAVKFPSGVILRFAGDELEMRR